MVKKKGLIGLTQLTGIVLVLVLVGILLVVGSKIDEDMISGVSTTTTRYENYTTTVIDDAANITQLNGRVTSLIRCTNNSAAGGVGIIPASNYSWSSTNPTRIYIHKDIISMPWDGVSWNCTYTALTDTASYNAAKDAADGLASVSENQGLLGIVIIFGVIISVVVVAFAIGKGGM